MRYQVCPSCGGWDVAEILYGPMDEKGYADELARKRVFFGGMIVREAGPHWLCNECRTAWCKQEDDLFHLDEFGEFVRI